MRIYSLKINKETIYRWLNENEGSYVSQDKKIKGMGKENTQLNNLATHLYLHNTILKELLEKNEKVHP